MSARHEAKPNGQDRAGTGPGRGQDANSNRVNAGTSPDRALRPGGRRNNPDPYAEWELGEEDE